MVQNISFSNIYTSNVAYKPSVKSPSFCATNPISSQKSSEALKSNAINQPRTTLTKDEQQKYAKVSDVIKNAPMSPNSFGVSPSKQLDALFRSGKLLLKSNHDNSTVLDNLYLIATTPRAQGLDSVTLISNTLDILCNPKIVTQTFGDISSDLKQTVVKNISSDNPVVSNPSLMDVYTSGTCAAASIEVNMADKFPAEFSRWVSELSSEKKELTLNVRLDSISQNKLEAINILNLLRANKTNFGLDKVGVKVDIDDGAHVRAYNQTKNWNKGERNVADVLIQSAIMKLGSQNTYNSLTDIREGDFSTNPQGLIELEKTFVESLIKNKEITSLVYQQIDDDQNLVGYNCSFDKIQKHITETIDSGDDVILGYVLTNETSGSTKAPGYNPSINGKPNKVINGHEITVVDYTVDKNGKTTFICVDTDDDSSEYVQYSADWLLPKIHHAGYPAYIVANDEAQIMKNMMS